MNWFKHVLFFFTSILCASEPLIQTLPKEDALLEQNLTIAGSSQLGAVSYENITGTGLVKLNGTTIRQMLQVSGSLLATSAKLASVEVFGEANLTQSFISQPSTIMGSIRAQTTTFKAPLTLGTQRAVFTSCKLESLIIRKDDAYKGKQIVELKQGTQVSGSIVFDSGKGEVHIYPSSQVLGPITGGKLIRKG